MRIGLIRRHYTPYGGAEVFLHRFITELLKRGHTLDMFSTNWEEREGVKVHKIKSWGPSFLKPLIFALNAGSAVDNIRPDVVLSLERTFCQDIYRTDDGCHREWLLKRGKTVSPLKRILIRLNPKHMALLFLEKKLFYSKRLKKVIAISKRVKEEIIRHYGLPDEKISVIYNGIDLSRFKPANSEEERRLARGSLGGDSDDTVFLLFVGSGFERKGLIYLIRALGVLKDKGDIRLVVIGKGRNSRYLKEAQRLGVDKRVIFMGPVNSSGYYSACDMLVLPSIYEPFGNVCLEAMAAGIPVITSRVAGASEVITDGVNGAILEDPTDHAEIARKITALLVKEKRKEMGRSAGIEASKYSIERNVTGFLDLIVKNKG